MTSMFVICFLFFLNSVLAAPTIQLPNGIIQGRQAETLAGVSYNVFEKIPFAKPPVGKLRFQPPQPPEDWEGILETTRYDAICHGIDTTSPLQTEDCLYLNVYTPALQNDTKTTYTVMFYIYGGGFINGDWTYFGPDFFINNDVIIVTTNYRTGPFGFLSTQDLVVPGNNGLWDQHAAINWTYNNIDLFGGDPEKITIFGQSAGSASVTYQLLHEGTKGLVRGAIGESGSFLSTWAFQRNSREIGFTTASLLNDTFTTSNDSQALLDFLLTVSAEDLNDAAAQYSSIVAALDGGRIGQGNYWSPVLEIPHLQAFITEKMYGKLLNGDVIRVPILTGFNSEEQLGGIEDLNVFKNVMGLYDQHLDWLVPDDMLVNDPEAQREIGDKIRDIYTERENFADHLPDGLEYYSDTAFTRAQIKFAELQSKFSEVYFYVFSYHGEMGRNDLYLEGAGRVRHGEELHYLWRETGDELDNSDPNVFPAQDVLVQSRLVKIWTDFGKYLNPTPEPSELLQNITWPLVDPEDFYYVDIGADLVVRQHPKGDHYKGWVELYESLGYDDFDTY